MDLNFDALNQGATAIPAAVKASTDAYGSLLQNAKVADMTVKANPDLPQRMGMTPEQYQSMSAQNRIAAVTGYTKAQGAQEMLQRIATERAQAQESTARAGYFQSFGAERAAQAQMQSQDDLGASRYAQTLDAQINNPDPNNPQAVAFAKSVPQGVKMQIRAAAQIGKTDARSSAALIRPLMQYFSGPGGQGGEAVTPQPIKDEQGNLIATPAPDGKGGFKWIQPKKSTAKFRMVYDSISGEMKPSVEADNIEDFQAGMKALNGITGGTPSGPDGAGSQPDPTDVKWLTDNPDPQHIASFEAKYGAGSAAQFTKPGAQ